MSEIVIVVTGQTGPTFASATTIADAGGYFAATTVEGALQEEAAARVAHIADTVDAHDASAISFAPTGTIGATDVQAAVAEVASESVQASVLTTNGDVLTRAAGVPARITRADLASDSAFTSRYVAQVANVTGTHAPALQVIQTSATDINQNGIEVQDNAANLGTLLQLIHVGDGYAFDISNRPGSGSPIVVHNYSSTSDAAMQIDNTRSTPFITLKNTENNTIDPGGFGAGDFLSLWGGSTGAVVQQGKLTKDLSFQALTTTTPWDFTPQVAVTALQVRQFFGAVGLQVTSNQAGSAGWHAARIDGYNFGARVSTVFNGGITLELLKTTTGNGDVCVVRNAGTGNSIDVRDGGTTSLWSVTAAGRPRWTTASTQQTTVGAAGGAAALPATPTTYLQVVNSAGTTLVIPAYAAA